MAGFNENLTGASPGDVKEFEVTYPEDCRPQARR